MVRKHCPVLKFHRTAEPPIRQIQNPDRHRRTSRGKKRESTRRNPIRLAPSGKIHFFPAMLFAVLFAVLFFIFEGERSVWEYLGLYFSWLLAVLCAITAAGRWWVESWWRTILWAAVLPFLLLLLAIGLLVGIGHISSLMDPSLLK